MNLIDVYLKTELFVIKDGLTIPISEFIQSSDSAIYVITAWNPGEARFTLEKNRQLNNEIEHLLEQEGYEYTRGIGKDPNSKYFEESIFVQGINQERALEIGRAYQQAAIFEIKKGTQSVLGCLDNSRVSRNL